MGLTRTPNTKKGATIPARSSTRFLCKRISIELRGTSVSVTRNARPKRRKRSNINRHTEKTKRVNRDSSNPLTPLKKKDRQHNGPNHIAVQYMYIYMLYLCYSIIHITARAAFVCTASVDHTISTYTQINKTQPRSSSSSASSSTSPHSTPFTRLFVCIVKSWVCCAARCRVAWLRFESHATTNACLRLWLVLCHPATACARRHRHIWTSTRRRVSRVSLAEGERKNHSF